MTQIKQEIDYIPAKHGSKRSPNSFINRMVWTKDHDTKLRILVKNYKGKKWKKVAQEMQNAFDDSELSAKKCRERWCNSLNPAIDRSSLTECEELLLLVYHHEFKNKWVAISRHLPRRNSGKLKNNFSSLVRKVARKIQSNEEECKLSFSEYAQTMYICVLIYDLASIKNSPKEAVMLAPIHLYEHIKGRAITPNKSIDYLKKITGEFILMNKTKQSLQPLLALDNINTIKLFLEKFIVKIKKSLTEKNLTEEVLFEIFEDILSSYESLPPQAPEQLSVPSLPVIPPQKIFVGFQPPLNQYEGDIPPIPELQNWGMSLLRPNFSHNSMLNFPFPLPTFQQSLPSKSQIFSTPTNPLFTPNYYLPIPGSGTSQLIETPDKSFMMTQGIPGVLDAGCRICKMGGSDFSSITNKFLQH